LVIIYLISNGSCVLLAAVILVLYFVIE